MPIEQLRQVVEVLTQEQNLYRDYVLGVEVPTTDSVLTDRNLTALEYYEVPLDSEIKEKIQSIAHSRVRSYLEDVEEDIRGIREYDISDAERDTVPLQYIRPDSIEYFDRYEQLLDDTGFEIASYDGLSDISFQALRISNDEGEYVIIFQKFSKRQLSGQADDLRVTEQEKEYEKFDNTVVTIPERVDCILYKNKIYVFNPKKFEDIFDYLREYETHANNVLTGIDDSDLRIHNMDDFVNSILNDRRVLRKMKSIEQRGLYDSLNRSEVENIINEFDLGIQIQTDDSGDWGIQIPDMRKKWDVIRLLDDDHLESSLTDSQYQVYGKDQRN